MALKSDRIKSAFYDKEKDLLYLKLGDAEDVYAFTFQEWLLIKVDASSGKPIALQIIGFAHLLALMVEYSIRHTQEPLSMRQPVGMRYDEATDDLWFTIQTTEELEARPLDQNVISYFTRRTGSLKSLRIPNYSQCWRAVFEGPLTKTLEVLIDELRAKHDQPRTEPHVKGPNYILTDFVSNANYVPLADLAMTAC